MGGKGDEGGLFQPSFDTGAQQAMPPYRRPSEVNWTPTKYDDCTVVTTGHPYRHQKGSGRSDALQHVTSGMTVKELTEVCAKHGYDSNFVVGSLLKQMTVDNHAFDIVAPEGTTLEAIKATRQSRNLSPEELQQREAKAAEKAAEKERKKAERAAKMEAAMAEREQKKAAAAEAKAKAKAEAEAKEAEAAAAGEGTTPAAAAPAAKGKGKGKAKAPAAEGEGASAG